MAALCRQLNLNDDRHFTGVIIFFLKFELLVSNLSRIFLEHFYRMSRLVSLLTGGKLRPHQRFIYLLAIWMCLCYGFFHTWISQEKNFILLQNNYNFGVNNRNNRLDITNKEISGVINKEQTPNDKNEMESFIQGVAPNVPYEFWMREKAKNSEKNPIKQKCAYFPSVFDIRFNNK